VRAHRDQLGKRAVGTFVGVAFVAIGAFAMLGADDTLPELDRGRAFWFGVTATVVGTIAVLGSWVTKDPELIWCRAPRRVWWSRTE
jgi:hypothetical protein